MNKKIQNRTETVWGIKLSCRRNGLPIVLMCHRRRTPLARRLCTHIYSMTKEVGASTEDNVAERNMAAMPKYPTLTTAIILRQIQKTAIYSGDGAWDLYIRPGTGCPLESTIHNTFRITERPLLKYKKSIHRNQCAYELSSISTAQAFDTDKHHWEKSSRLGWRDPASSPIN